jgi:hypothetical protein
VTALRRAAVLLVAVLVLLSGAPAIADAAPATPAATRVLIVGVPGLTWDDVSEKSTPTLWSLAEVGSIGAISVRAVRSTTCLPDGWLSLGAGNRAQLPDPVPPPPLVQGTARCGWQQTLARSGLGSPEAAVARAAADPGTVRFGSQPGALGRGVGCASVIGRPAALAVAAPGVRLTTTDTVPGTTAGLGALLGGCPLTVVSLDQLVAAGMPGVAGTATGTDPALRPQALTAIDAAVARLRAATAALPGPTLLILQGISEVNDGRPQLHVGIVAGPAFGSGWLTSASTGRSPFAELIDVAPTALDALGRTPPTSMNGQELGTASGRPALAQAIAQLDRTNVGAVVHYRRVGTFFWVLVVLVALLVLGGLFLLGWVPPVAPRNPAGPRRLAALRTVAMALAALPVATYLADLAPWERAGSPTTALLAALVLADLAVLGLAVLGPWRRVRWGPALVVLVVTWVTLLADVVTGSHLELDGLLGYDAIVAGRFVGYGNLTFGLHVVCALLVTAAIADRAGRRARPGRERWVRGGTVVGIGLVTVAVMGWPSLGRDFGGVLAALPGFLLLAMLMAQLRVTIVRLLAILGAGVLAVGVVATLDWMRPPPQRTHLGRFVAQLLDGEAWTVVSRKGQANLDILRGSALAWMLPVAVLAVLWLVGPGGRLRRSSPDFPAGLPAQDVAVLRAGLTACLLSLAVGAAGNDSGVAVPATAAALLVPLLVWLTAGGASGPAASGEVRAGSPRPEPAEAADRVTVVSRGSTDRNA